MYIFSNNLKQHIPVIRVDSKGFSPLLNATLGNRRTKAHNDVKILVYLSEIDCHFLCARHNAAAANDT
jgi:hypothetical protein